MSMKTPLSVVLLGILLFSLPSMGIPGDQSSAAGSC